MTRIQTLSDLQPGQSAVVRSVCAPDGMQQRLRDLGLIEHTRVVCLGRSPMGDPSAYLIRGSVIALRRCDIPFDEAAARRLAAQGKRHNVPLALRGKTVRRALYRPIVAL